jgi:hypothetical protein
LPAQLLVISPDISLVAQQAQQQPVNQLASQRRKQVRNSMLLDVARTTKWIEALEANGGKQIKWDFNGPDDTHCALGLLNSLHENPCRPGIEISYEDVSQRHNISVKFIKAIASLNDGVCYGQRTGKLRPHTFAEIANILKIRLRTQQEFMGVIQCQKQPATIF